MHGDQQIRAYVNAFLEPEGEILRAARARSEEADIPTVPPQTGALLRFLARVARARYAVEVGSGGGYSGLWLLGGLDPKGSLTTIEIAAAHQALAQRAFTEAKVADRIRSILGPALAVLPKLSDSSYDVVFLDAAKVEYPDYLVHAKRLLHPGGLLLADNVLWGGKVPDPAVTDDDTIALREFNDMICDDPDWHGLIFDVGDGVLGAVYDPQ